MRITNKIFTDLAIFMSGFGILVGLIFPFIILFFDFDRNIVLSWPFITVCISAGIIVGIINYILSKNIIVSRLNILTKNMKSVEETLLNIASGNEIDICTLQDCELEIHSDDEIGNNFHAYKKLVNALAIAIQAETLTTYLEIDTLSRKALNQFLDNLGSNAGMILINRNDKLSVSYSYGIKSPDKILNNKNVYSVLENKKRAHINVPDNVIIQGTLTEFVPAEIIFEPIIYNDKVLGIVMLASSSSYDDNLLLNLSIFSRSLSLAMNNAFLLDKTQKLAAYDSLTGAVNKRYGMERLKEEYSRAVRTKNNLSLVMIDLDDYKNINDKYGHLAGDKVLITTSKIISSLLRDEDVFIRFGGDEFCILLPGADSGNAFNIAERVRKKISDYKIKYNEIELKMTLSIGVSTFSDSDERINIQHESDLILFADKALYKAKENGKNQTVAFNYPINI